MILLSGRDSSRGLDPTDIITRLVLADETIVEEIDFGLLVISADALGVGRIWHYAGVRVSAYDLTTSYSLPDEMGTVTNVVTHVLPI